MSGFWWLIHSFVALLLSLSIYLLWFRLVIHYFRFSKNNTMVNFVYHWTDCIIKPLTRGFISKGLIEWPTFALIFILEMIKIYSLTWLLYGIAPKVGLVLIVILGDLLIYPLQLWFYAFILRILLGWFPVLRSASLNEIIYGMTDPCMQYSRNWMSPVGGYDFLPLAWIMILKGLSFFIYISMPLHVG